MRYDRLTRWLHAGIALGVTAQLGLSLIMEAPDDKDEELVTGLPLQLFMAHEYIGMALLALILLHWLWSLSGHVHGGFGHLFPWFSGERMKKVIAEARDAMSLKLPDPNVSNELAGAIHGLGLIVATALAVTGAVIFFNLDVSTGHISELGDELHEVHEAFGPLMWGYLIIHVIGVGLHKRMGHNLVKDISPLA